MRTPRSDSDVRAACADEVAEYLRVALQPRFLGLRTDDLLCVVESVWNNYEPGSGPPPVDTFAKDVDVRVLRELAEELHRARDERFGHAPYFLFAFDFEYEAKDIVFTCDVMWPEGPGMVHLLLRLDRDALAPPENN